MKDKLYKKFSIGLNLNETEEDILAFFDKYKDYLSSVYFSLPLGDGFYSRNELAFEYEADGAEEKLLRIVKKLPEYDIRSEVAVNIYGLNEDDLLRAVKYMNDHDFYPDEIVCLDEYGSIFKKAFPQSELKYSFNNPGNASDVFDTIVVGKSYLRDRDKRHEIIDSGRELVILLNNGCSFECHYKCGDSRFCGAILNKNLESKSLDYMYSIQSFFPSELDRLFNEDDYADKYRFKLSNRPLGLEFSKRVMDVYCGLSDKSETDYILEDSMNYGLFCVMYELFRRRDSFSLNNILEIKRTLKV